VVPDIAGEALSDAGLARLRAVDPGSLPVVDPGVRLGACVGGVGKFMCIGLNYADHAAESGLKVPPEPVLFLKANSAICV
jgi:2-keto-4-pentenoate hydratase/2-oxohepta-3-ene-1,7-dioic acid hydratase in catechol pathway